MKISVMLTVDLNRGVSEEAREKFNESLKQQEWKKLKLTTTWYATFIEGVTSEAAISAAKADVKRAAAHASISNYEAAAEAGYSVPAVWNQIS